MGLRLSGTHQHVPDVVIGITRMLGALTIPLIMLILGGTIYVDYKKTDSHLFKADIIKFVIIKNIAFPIIFLLILIVIKPPFIVALLIMLQSMVPPVTATPLVTERAGGDRGVVNQLLVGSFLFSVISIPVMMYLFSLYFPF